MGESKLQTAFRQAISSYRREDGVAILDARDTYYTGLLKCDPMALLLMDTADFAAILSRHVSCRLSPKEKAPLLSLKGSALRAYMMEELNREQKLPLIENPESGMTRQLLHLINLEGAGGANLYRKVALLLDWAGREKSLARIVGGKRTAQQTKHKATACAAMGDEREDAAEDADEPRHKPEDLFDPKDSDPDSDTEEEV